MDDLTNANGTLRDGTRLGNAIDNTGAQQETARVKRLEALAWKYLIEGQSATRRYHESGRNQKNHLMGRLARILKCFGHGLQR